MSKTQKSTIKRSKLVAKLTVYGTDVSHGVESIILQVDVFSNWGVCPVYLVRQSESEPRIVISVDQISREEALRLLILWGYHDSFPESSV